MSVYSHYQKYCCSVGKRFHFWSHQEYWLIIELTSEKGQKGTSKRNYTVSITQWTMYRQCIFLTVSHIYSLEVQWQRFLRQSLVVFKCAYWYRIFVCNPLFHVIWVDSRKLFAVSFSRCFLAHLKIITSSSLSVGQKKKTF